MAHATEPAVREFLVRLKEAIEKHDLKVVNRTKNRDALAELGLTFEIQREVVLGLTTQDFSEGPVPDRDKPGYVWIFGPALESRRLYIKLKLADSGDGPYALCISFHPAEFPLELPYKGE